MVKVGIHAVGCAKMSEHASKLIAMPCNEFALVVGKKSYRFHIDSKTSNLILPLINGVDCHIDTYDPYPAVVLIQTDRPYVTDIFEEK